MLTMLRWNVSHTMHWKPTIILISVFIKFPKTNTSKCQNIAFLLFGDDHWRSHTNSSFCFFTCSDHKSLPDAFLLYNHATYHESCKFNIYSVNLRGCFLSLSEWVCTQSLTRLFFKFISTPLLHQLQANLVGKCASNISPHIGRCAYDKMSSQLYQVKLSHSKETIGLISPFVCRVY